MLSIAFSLLGAWILSWFGFNDLMINGANEVFGLILTNTGYYFIFGIVGIIKSILSHLPKDIVIKDISL